MFLSGNNISLAADNMLLFSGNIFISGGRIASSDNKTEFPGGTPKILESTILPLRIIKGRWAGNTDFVESRSVYSCRNILAKELIIAVLRLNNSHFYVSATLSPPSFFTDHSFHVTVTRYDTACPNWCYILYNYQGGRNGQA